MSDKPTIKDILTDIYDRHGKLTPEIVREEARPADSPIHSYVFSKDVSDAAEEYYLERAHKLIQSVRVVVHRDAERTIAARAWLAVPGSEDRYIYEPVAEVMSNEILREQARKEFERNLRSAEEALETFDLLCPNSSPSPPTEKARRALKTARRELAKAA